MILFYSQKTISTLMKNIVFLTFYLYFYEIQSFVPFILIGKKKRWIRVFFTKIFSFGYKFMKVRHFDGKEVTDYD